MSHVNVCLEKSVKRIYSKIRKGVLSERLP